MAHPAVKFDDFLSTQQEVVSAVARPFGSWTLEDSLKSLEKSNYQVQKSAMEMIVFQTELAESLSASLQSEQISDLMVWVSVLRRNRSFMTNIISHINRQKLGLALMERDDDNRFLSYSAGQRRKLRKEIAKFRTAIERHLNNLIGLDGAIKNWTASVDQKIKELDTQAFLPNAPKYAPRDLQKSAAASVLRRKKETLSRLAKV